MEGIGHGMQANSAPEQQVVKDDTPQAVAPFQRLKPTHLSMLRYRAQDVLRGLTKAVVREARAKDLKMEILNSTRLQVCSWNLRDFKGDCTTTLSHPHDCVSIHG
jgi:hypothetical protein